MVRAVLASEVERFDLEAELAERLEERAIRWPGLPRGMIGAGGESRANRVVCASPFRDKASFWIHGSILPRLLTVAENGFLRVAVLMGRAIRGRRIVQRDSVRRGAGEGCFRRDRIGSRDDQFREADRAIDGLTSGRSLARKLLAAMVTVESHQFAGKKLRRRRARDAGSGPAGRAAEFLPV